MDYAELIAELRGFEADLSNRGFITPAAVAHIHWFNELFELELRFRTSESGTTESFTFRDADPAKAFLEARTFVTSELKTPEQQARNEFIRSLGKLIDQGNDIGIDIEMMNPLQQLMTNLSENIISLRTD